MALLDHNGECIIPLPKEAVFEAILKAVPTIKGMKIDSSDKLLSRIMVKSGVSLFSWGENIPIQLSDAGEGQTRLQITSSPKTGSMGGGAFDLGKNRKNIEAIISATSRTLQEQA